MKDSYVPNTITSVIDGLEFFKKDYPESTDWYTDVLVKYSKNCDSVVEFGTWNGLSALVFANAGVKDITSVDIDFTRCNQNAITRVINANGNKINWIAESSTKGKTDLSADLMFFDTLHSYKQVKNELNHRANKAKKYIIVHDTNFPKGSKPTKRVRDAVIEYVNKNADLVVALDYTDYTGIMVVERR